MTTIIDKVVGVARVLGRSARDRNRAAHRVRARSAGVEVAAAVAARGRTAVRSCAGVVVSGGDFGKFVERVIVFSLPEVQVTEQIQIKEDILEIWFPSAADHEENHGQKGLQVVFPRGTDRGGHRGGDPARTDR